MYKTDIESISHGHYSVLKKASPGNSFFLDNLV